MEEAKWYVAHTFSGYENKVASDLKIKVENQNLTDLIQDIVIPTETVVEIKDDGTKKEVERKIFPSYILVKMVMTHGMSSATHVDVQDLSVPRASQLLSQKKKLSVSE